MGASGTTTIDFGAFPGSGHATVAITGQAGIVSGSLVEAWLRPVDTADHTADEHIVDGPLIFAGNIVAATGFTIHGVARPGLAVPDAMRRYANMNSDNSVPQYQDHGRTMPMPYGLWTIAWVWN
jgi:hypothetical protein